MRNNLHVSPKPFVLKMIVLITCFMLVIFYNKSKAAGVTKSPINNTFKGQVLNKP